MEKVLESNSDVFKGKVLLLYERNKKVAIVHRYFWPQNYPYASMLKDISESLIGKGADLSVYTSYSGLESENKQREVWQRETGATIHSVSLPSERSMSVVKKTWYAAKFFVWLFYKLLMSRQDIFMVATTPPVLIAFLVTVISKLKGADVIYHCQDIHPESLYVNKSLNSMFLYKVLKFLDTYTVRNASKVIVLSEDMKKTLTRRGVSGENIHVINNFIFHFLEAGEQKSLDDFEPQDEKVRFLFAGSLGRFQNLKLLIKAIGFFKDRKDIEFLFLGDGPLKPVIKEYCQSNDLDNVLFREQVPVDDALRYMYASDVGLVSISEGVADVAYPSKSIMYFSTGLPVLAVVDEHSELFRMVNDNGLGIAVFPREEEIHKGIERIVKDIRTQKISREQIRAFAQNKFSKTRILDRFSNVIMEAQND